MRHMWVGDGSSGEDTREKRIGQEKNRSEPDVLELARTKLNVRRWISPWKESLSGGVRGDNKGRNNPRRGSVKKEPIPFRAPSRCIYLGEALG